MRVFSLFAFIVLLSSVAPGPGNIHAQECPASQRAAIQTTLVACADMAETNLCVGNPPVTSDAAGLTAPGDRTDTFTSVSIGNDEGWGLAVLNTVAYNPDDWQDVAVRWIGLGQASLNAEPAPVLIFGTVRTAEGVNLRTRPQDDARIVRALQRNQRIALTGQTADGNWLRAQLASGEVGWVLASAIHQPGALLTAVTVDDDNPPLRTPYTVVTLEGTGNRPCDNAPPAGWLIQTGAPARLALNDLSLILDGTVFITTAEGEMALAILSGQATLDLAERTTLRAGRFIRLIAEENAWVAGQSAPYQIAPLASLPFELLTSPITPTVDLDSVVTRNPGGPNPIASLLVTDACTITPGAEGAFLRSGPGSDFPRIGTLNYRDSARPAGRFMRDGVNWWQIAPFVWVRGDVVVTGGDCVRVPLVETPR